MATKKDDANPQEGARLAGGYDLPEKILIVGVDPIPPEIQEQVAHLEDPERNLEPNPGLVSSIAVHGVQDFVQVMAFRLPRAWKAPWGEMKSGDRVRVAVDGRQRVRATRIANSEHRDDFPRMVPYVVMNACDGLTPTIMNEFRREDSIIAKAHKVKRLQARGFTIPQIATSFGDGKGSIVSEATIRNWLLLLTLRPEEIKAIESGEMTPSEGYELARTRKNGKGAASSEDGEDSGGGGKREASGRPTKNQIAALLEELTPGTQDEPDPGIDAAGSVLRWVLGQEPKAADEFIAAAIAKASKRKGSGPKGPKVASKPL